MLWHAPKLSRVPSGGVFFTVSCESELSAVPGLAVLFRSSAVTLDFSPTVSELMMDTLALAFGVLLSASFTDLSAVDKNVGRLIFSFS